MRLIMAFVLLVVMAGPAVALDCYPELEKGDTMSKILELCGEPDRRQSLGSDMDVRDKKAGQAKMLTIEHSRTENIWTYENAGSVHLRFVNGELVEKSLRDER